MGIGGIAVELNDIKAYLESNKSQPEVQSYLNELSALSADKVKDFLDTDEGKRLVQPALDKYHAKSLASWKTNNLNGLIEDELKKRNPDKSPAEIEIAQLRKEIEDERNLAKKEKNMNTAIKQATAKGLPVDILDIFVSHDEESSTANYGRLEDSFTKAVQAAVDNKFKQGGRNFNNDGSNNKADAGAYGKKIADNAAGTNTGLEEARKSYFE